jgi:hypothetical protein
VADFSRAERRLTLETGKSTSAKRLHSRGIMRSLAVLGMSPAGSDAGKTTQPLPAIYIPWESTEFSSL